ncbi:MAG: NAD(P)/FAD-dependent oxidoreductase, partial [Deltaproteobacteria bacterium]|nr:NAD(P)/FAD-dependent oxidoreductase [Deltaproteobacteria bacterium]
VPRMPYGLLTPETLETIARIARKHEVPIIKITSAQRIALVGIEPEKVADAWIDLGMQVGPAQELCVHYVQACPGNDWCRFGLQDSLGLGGRLEQIFVGRELPAKAKFGISGCHFNCAEGWVRDFGAFGKKKGWSVVVGGNSARKPRIGDLIAEDVTEDDVVEMAGRFFSFYAENAKKKERTSRFVARVGIDEVKKAVLSG